MIAKSGKELIVVAAVVFLLISKVDTIGIYSRKVE